MEVVQAQMPELVAAVQELTQAMYQLTAAQNANVAATISMSNGFAQIAQSFQSAMTPVATAIQGLQAQNSGGTP
jgi:hemoglobin-like flavoprotein